jgi:hypothetical protein
MLCPAQGSRKVTPSSDKEALFDVAVHYAQEGVKGIKKRRKQRLQGTTTTTSRDDDRDSDAGGSGVNHTATTTTTHSYKRLARIPTDRFRRLLKEACPNHASTIRQELKEYGMMRSFKTLGALA